MILRRLRLRGRHFDGCSVEFINRARLFAIAVSKQSYAYSSLRIKRYGQILELYRQLYTFNMLRSIWNSALRRNMVRFERYRNQTGVLFSAAVLFNFKSDGVSDGEMERVVNLCNEIDPSASAEGGQISKLKLEHEGGSYEWQIVIDQHNFRMWRRPEFQRPHLNEYKCIGRIDDIPATAFFAAQLDLDYRKQWDTYLIKLEVVEKDEGGQEVIRWLTKYPYPMYPREYVYVRRAYVDTEKGVMVLRARAVDHPNCPNDPKSAYVRVPMYHSEMVIVPHTTFDEKGFEYVATHFVDPNSSVPNVAYNYGVKYGLPGFVDEIHKAAKRLDEQKSWKRSLENWENESYWQKFLTANANIL